jgi:hypothetical protein
MGDRKRTVEAKEREIARDVAYLPIGEGMNDPARVMVAGAGIGGTRVRARLLVRKISRMGHRTPTEGASPRTSP